MKKSLFIGFILAAITVVSIPLTTRAERGSSKTTEDTTVKMSDDNVAVDTETKTETETEVKTESVHGATTKDIQAKRDLMEQKMAERKAAIAEKLTGKRQETCQKKQAAINKIIDSRVNAAQRHLDRFNTIRDRLVAFVAAKKLTVENASALEVIMNDKQAAAQAAVDAAGTVNFACADADATSPGQIVMDQVAAQKQALKDYRTAIKNYAVAVKSAAASTKTSDGEGN